MKRINANIEDSVYATLIQLPGTLSENVERAIKEYLANIYKVNVSASKSNGQK